MVRVWVLLAGTRLSTAAGSDLSVEVYRRTLHQPYEVHLSRNSSEIVGAVIGKVNTVVLNVLQPLMLFTSSLILSSAIALALVVIDPFVAISAVAVFGLSYVAISAVTRARLRNNSARVATEQVNVVKAVQEGLGGIRDVLLDGTQGLYTAVYRNADRPLRRAQANVVFISRSPRYLMEIIGMVALAGVAFFLAGRSDITTVLPLLGALALGAQRLLPTLQQAYASWALVNGNLASLQDVNALLEQPAGTDSDEHVEPLEFDTAITLSGITFGYHNTQGNVIERLDLTIHPGQSVGFIGPTGSGKTTLLDLIMSLLSPSGTSGGGRPANRDSERSAAVAQVHRSRSSTCLSCRPVDRPEHHVRNPDPRNRHGSCPPGGRIRKDRGLR